MAVGCAAAVFVDWPSPADWSLSAQLQTVQPSGLMGGTWNRTAPTPPSEEDNRERDDDLMGCNVATSKRCATPSHQRREKQPQPLSPAEAQAELSSVGKGEWKAGSDGVSGAWGMECRHQ